MDFAPWWNSDNYPQLKAKFTQEAISRLAEYFDLNPETIILVEAATPKTFADYTARHKGIVGGIGQRISTFGPFGFANRTPVRNLWLVGDSTHPGKVLLG